MKKKERRKCSKQKLKSTEALIREGLSESSLGLSSVSAWAELEVTAAERRSSLSIKFPRHQE